MSKPVPRLDRLIKERRHDPYRARMKLAEPTLCRQCGAVYRNGRWQWPNGSRLADAHTDLCQACRRIADRCAAGEVELSGAFLREHRDEIMALVRHQNERESTDHPLHRIMAMEETPDRVMIATTDIHLPRRIGEAVHSAYQGELSYQYQPEEYFLRVRWSR